VSDTLVEFHVSGSPMSIPVSKITSIHPSWCAGAAITVDNHALTYLVDESYSDVVKKVQDALKEKQ